jgi:hypothetical protein
VNEIEKPGNEILDSNQFGWDWAGGPDLSVCRCLDCCCSIQARYFAIDGWTSSATRAGDVYVVLPWTTVRAQGTATYVNGADLYSVEVNLRRLMTSWLTLLAGFRHVEYDEGLLAQFAPTGGPAQDIFAVDTDNHLYGGQIGAEAALGSIGHWRLDSWLKAGVYANHADQTTTLLTPISASAGASQDRTAFVGSVGISLCRPVTRCLAFWTGYQAMWLDGVALAPSQLAVTNVQNNYATVDADDSLLLHGVTLGMDLTW